MSTTFQINIDAHDTEALATFWAATLGYVLEPPPEGFSTWEEFATEMNIPEEKRGDLAAAVDPAGVQPRLLFSNVPEDKIVKNRIHLDVSVTESSMELPERRRRINDEVTRLKDIGATRVEDRGDHNQTWTVMLDPEGNEFCIQ
jgi:hypothetical protein